MIFKKSIDSIKITTLMENCAGKSKPFVAQHGISFFIEMYLEGKKQYLLFDTGQNSQLVLENMKLLGIDRNLIDRIFLSHCHYDHTGGLLGIVQSINRDIKIISHPEIFRDLYSKKSGKLRYQGIPKNITKEKIECNKGEFYFTKIPEEIMPGVMTTGEINNRNSLKDERVTKNEKDEFLPDYMDDDISLIINIKEKGNLIITGCSHSGIIEIVEKAIDITNNKKIYGIIGGFHLLANSEEENKEIINKLSEFNPEIIASGHCTGFNAIYLLKKKFQDKFERLEVGKVIKL